MSLTRFRHSAKYIEGLENRVNRMEQLLRLSGKWCQLATLVLSTIQLLTIICAGILSDDDPNADLGVLEKKLAEKSRQASSATGSAPVSPKQADGSTPRSSLASPGKASQDNHYDKRKSIAEGQNDHDSDSEKEEVEALSEMMCSLVTNQCGETRYIGKHGQAPSFGLSDIQLTWHRFIFRIFHLLAQRHSMGEFSNR
jgi:hypothetical protein